MSLLQVFNAVEAVWWICVAAVLIAAVPGPRRTRATLAVLFFLFGCSDLVEMWSGAWWRPWWLAAWKIACGVAIAVLVLRLVRQARRSDKSGTGEDRA